MASTRRKRRSRRGWDQPEDELVPIARERVVAALHAYGISITEMARDIGDSQQTVSLICTGVTKRTRRSRVQRMADVFGLPPEWLTGSLKDLPGLASGWTGGHIYARRGDSDHPAAWQLAIAKWETQVERAYNRDNEENRRTRLEHYMRERFALGFMIHPGVWRDLLFGPNWRGVVDRDDVIDQETQVQLVNFMLDVLQPWLDGKAKLNYRNLLYIFGGVANEAIQALKSEPEWEQRLAES